MDINRTGGFSRILQLLVVFALVTAIAAGCADNETEQGDTPGLSGESLTGERDGLDRTAPSREGGQRPDPMPPPEPEYAEATLIAVGDIMMHLPQTRSGYDPETGTYSFHHFFAEVKPLLSSGDWVIGNLETPLVDNDRRGYTGYPEFNAPPELADALKEAGFGLLTTANNHSLDRREAGLVRTLENLRERGLVPVGTHASPEEAEIITTVAKNGIEMAFLAYTYGTNGIPVPEGKDYLVNLIDADKIMADMDKARRAGADVITVSLHFGQEYQTMPNEEQKTLAHALLKAGADIILGSHPHVLQPYEIVSVEREDGSTGQGVILYSMGNFISNQDRTLNRNKPTEIGAIFEIGLQKQMPGGPVTITGVRAMPTYVHKLSVDGQIKHRVLPLEDVLTVKDDEWLTERDYARLAAYLEETAAHLAALLPAEPSPAPETAASP